MVILFKINENVKMIFHSFHILIIKTIRHIYIVIFINDHI